MQPACRSDLAVRMASLLARAEGWLRPADQLDYAIRRWLIPIRLETTAPDQRIFVKSSGLSRDLLAHIGSCLRAQYNLAQPIPHQLNDLLQEFERRAALP